MGIERSSTTFQCEWEGWFVVSYSVQNWSDANRWSTQGNASSKLQISPLIHTGSRRRPFDPHDVKVRSYNPIAIIHREIIFFKVCLNNITHCWERGWNSTFMLSTESIIFLSDAHQLSGRPRLIQAAGKHRRLCHPCLCCCCKAEQAGQIPLIAYIISGFPNTQLSFSKYSSEKLPNTHHGASSYMLGLRKLGQNRI